MIEALCRIARRLARIDGRNVVTATIGKDPRPYGAQVGRLTIEHLDSGEVMVFCGSQSVLIEMAGANSRLTIWTRPHEPVQLLHMAELAAEVPAAGDRLPATDSHIDDAPVVAVGQGDSRRELSADDLDRGLGILDL
jgi:hypothetical protein